MLSIGKCHQACGTATPEQRAAAMPWLIIWITCKCMVFLSCALVLLLGWILPDVVSTMTVLIWIPMVFIADCLIELLSFGRLNYIMGERQSGLLRSGLIRLALLSGFAITVTSHLWLGR